MFITEVIVGGDGGIVGFIILKRVRPPWDGQNIRNTSNGDVIHFL